jgi:hypothetical protein
MPHRKIIHTLRQLSIAGHIIAASVATLAALHVITPSNWLLAALIAWANASSLTNRITNGSDGGHQ